MGKTDKGKHTRKATHHKAAASALPPANARIGIRGYGLLNLVFFGFCIVQLVIVRILLRDFAGLYFFFGFLMCAFFAVSVFDYVANRFIPDTELEETDFTSNA